MDNENKVQKHSTILSNYDEKIKRNLIFRRTDEEAKHIWKIQKCQSRMCCLICRFVSEILH